MSDPAIQRSEMILKDAFDLALAAHRRQAHQSGYTRAIADVMAAAVFIAEQTLRTAPDPADARAILYQFIAKLETQTQTLASGEGDVSDGAGI